MVPVLLLLGLPTTLCLPAIPTPLPSCMLGDFKMESSVGFDAYMAALGMDWLTRQFGNTLYPLQKIRQATNGQISLDTITTFRTTKTKFFLDEEWDEHTADGRDTTTVASLDGYNLIKVQVPDATTGYHTTTETREFVDDDGDGKCEVMKLILQIQGNPLATAVRFYERVADP